MPVATDRMRKGRFRRVLWSVIGLALIGVAFLIFWQPKSSFLPLPQPNGYDALTQAAAKIVSRSRHTGPPDSMELTLLVSTNREALAELRRGLQLPCVVPIQASEEWIQSWVSNLMNLKTAALAFDAEADDFSRRGDAKGGLASCLDLLRFGETIGRGGLEVDFLVGSACELIAMHRMTNLMNSLDTGLCKQAALAIHEREERLEPLDDIVTRDREWTRKTYGIAQRVRMMISSRSLHPDRTEEVHFGKLYAFRVREERTVMLLLAARAFALERGAKPLRASDLVPDYLPSIRTDPSSGKPLELP